MWAYYPIALVLSVITSLWFVFQERRRPDVSPFKPLELALVIITCLVNPIIIGSIFSYGLRSISPRRAQQANHISMVLFIVWLGGLYWVAL